MDKVFALQALFSSRVRLKLLELFASQPLEEFHSRQLARLTTEHHNAVWREVQHLEAAGWLVSRMQGNRKQYRPDPDNPLFPLLQSLILTAGGLGARVSPARAQPVTTCVERASVPARSELVVGEND
jgi:hypothetical protein